MKKATKCKSYYSDFDYEGLIVQLYEAFFGSDKETLNDVFEKYKYYRVVDCMTLAKTAKEDINYWNKFFRDSIIGNMPVQDITVSDIKAVFLTMTANYQLTSKCFNSAKSVLKGVFDFYVDKGNLPANLVTKVDMKQFKKRFKPEDPSHDNYSEEELSKLVHYFREKKDKDSYDYAIWFALNSCLRIGEIRSLKYSSFQSNTYRVDCATSNVPQVTVDEDHNIVFGNATPTETYVKGNTSYGFRDMPITSDIATIVSELKSKYPDNKYLFMSKGSQIAIVTFNRRLKKVCEELDIKYRSSHKIRFTNCDRMYYSAGINMKDMQSFMGHSKPSMTEHYFNQHTASEEGLNMAKDCLSIA